MPILIGVTTGLRRGEILGLRWQDVDLLSGILSVRQSLGLIRSDLLFDQPKTVKSRRTVALPTLITEALGHHRDPQQEVRHMPGKAYRDHDLVIAGADGSPRSPLALTHGVSHLLISHGSRRVRFHDLRHSHASQLLKQGVYPKIVSEQLGHSAIGLTLDTYSHLLPGMQEEAAKEIDVMLRAALGRI